jgi:hypothetical protein
VITGSSVLTSNITTYTFGVNASDGQNQDVTRSYTITVNSDVVTWSSPANGATVNLNQNTSSTTTLTAASAAGKAVTYTANALPTGLSISGNVVTGTPTTVGNTVTLLTANATSTTRTATITVTWNVVVGNDVYFKNTTLLLSGNGTNNANNNTILDSSTNNYTINRVGNTVQGTFSPFGEAWSNYFDGSSKFTTASNAAFGFGTGDFTIELWVFCSFNGTIQELIDGRASDIATPWVLGINATGLARSYDGTTLRTGGQLTANSWNHIAWVRASNVNTIYVNGASGHTWTASQDFGSTRPLTIANNVGPTSEPLTGYISNLRIVKGTALYTANFTPPTSSLTAVTNTVLLTCQSNRFVDNSSNNFAITKTGAASVQRFNPFAPTNGYSTSVNGGSIYFDGNGDYLNPTCASYSMGTNWTMELWYNCPTTLSGILFDCRPDNTNGFYLDLSVGGTGLSLYYNATDRAITTPVTTGSWNHVAVVKNSGAVYTYHNGVQVDSFSDSNTWQVGTDRPRLSGNGGFYGAAPGNSQAYISNLRFVPGTALYTANFTPSTTPLTAIAGTKLLLSGTNAGIIDSTMINNIETVGDAKISTAQSKFGGSSIYFDGTGDWLVCQDSPNQEFGSGNLTWEMWIYTTTSTQYATLYSRSPASFQVGMWSLMINYTSATAGDIALFVGDYSLSTNLVLTSGVSVRDGAWHHIAVVRNGSAWTIYVDGTSRGTGTWAGTISDLAYGPYIGADQYYGRAYTGYIDDLRITKGVARYTANFTPPATALSTQ